MPTRRAARERALGLAYECEQRDVARPKRCSPNCPSTPTSTRVASCPASTSTTTRSTRSSASISEHWALERMPVVDRALLRIGTYELGWMPEMPTAVVITEAVELAKQYSTKDSGRFVNGLLARIADDVRSEPSEHERDRVPAPRRSSFPTPSRSCSATKTFVPTTPWVVIVWNDPSTSWTT